MTDEVNNSQANNSSVNQVAAIAAPISSTTDTTAGVATASTTPSTLTADAAPASASGQQEATLSETPGERIVGELQAGVVSAETVAERFYHGFSYFVEQHVTQFEADITKLEALCKAEFDKIISAFKTTPAVVAEPTIQADTTHVAGTL